MARYEWIHPDSPCKTCLRKDYAAGGLSRCIEYKRFGKTITVKGREMPRLMRCSNYIGPHPEKHYPGWPYYSTLAEMRGRKEIQQ